METSQQQRGPAVGQLAQALAQAKLTFDAIDLADMLWLAQFVEPGDGVRSDVAEAPPDQGSLEGDRKVPPETETVADEPAFNLYPEEPPPPPPAPSPEIDQVEPEVAKPQGLPFSVPAAPAIRTRMDLARSLRPLMRKVPSRTRFDLDEEATATQIAETEVWMPVVKPTVERWLELEFVVESSKTTAIWERAISELNHLVEYQGAFRTVRTWRLAAQGNRLQLFPRWRDGVTTATPAELANSARPHTPRELIDSTSRRLIWLVTDCISPLWRQGIIHPTLRQWAMAQPVAIVQMFPDSLWKRTALRDGHPVKLSALAPGLPSARLEVEGLPRRLERRGGADLATVPVVTLDAQALRHWARVIAGAGDSRTPGRVFDLVFIKRQAEVPKVPASPATAPTAQERVDLFRATTTSETVKHLANLIAATPVVSLPVIDLLRDAFRADFHEEVRQSHVAEVLLSGLLRRCDAETDDVCRYEFWGDDSTDPSERVRDLLLGDASVSKTLEVLNVLSASIELKITSPVKTFQALLAAIQESDDAQLLGNVLPFAQVGLNVLHRLGGEHAAFARQYEQVLQRKATNAEAYFNRFSFQDLEYEVAEFINFPTLVSFEFTEAQFEEDDDPPPFPPPLQTDKFTVITVDLQPSHNSEQISENTARRLLEQKTSEIKQLIIQNFEQQEIEFQLDMNPGDVLSENIDDSEISISSKQEIDVEFLETEFLGMEEMSTAFQITTEIRFAVDVGYFDFDGYISEIHESPPHTYVTWLDQSVHGKASVHLQGLEELTDTEVDSVDLELDVPILVRETTELVSSVAESSPALEPFDFIVATIQRGPSPQQERRSLFGGLFSNRSNSPTDWEVQQQQQQAYRFIERLPYDIPIEMVAIPGGTFLMGSPDDEPERADDEGPQHEVTVPPFLMGRYPVTQTQWRAVSILPQIEREIAPNPSHFEGNDRPVDRVTWYDAVEFCARLSIHTGRQYRLPTEAEWEYACRAGTTTPFHFGETIRSDLATYRGYIGYASGPAGDAAEGTNPVDHHGLANAFGLCDMHGNVWEWCQDSWHSSYKGAPTDSRAWIEGGNSNRRILRGGSWVSYPRLCRSASRNYYKPDYDDNMGFRVVCTASRRRATAPSALQRPTG